MKSRLDYRRFWPGIVARGKLVLLGSFALAVLCLMQVLSAVSPASADVPIPLNSNPTWYSAEPDETWSVAWGDVDGDGDLDLAVGNTSRNRLYLNDEGELQTSASWTAGDLSETQSVAWGDVDGDGDLDLAAGNSSSTNKVYLNLGGTLEISSTWVSSDTLSTYSVAWGDVDGDGDLDLAAGNRASGNKVYLNSGGTLELAATWTCTETDHTFAVAWGDVDGDGDLDLAVANSFGQENRVYLNLGGTLETTASWSSGDTDWTESIAWGDVDGDGDLDLAVGNGNWRSGGLANKVYLNVGGVLQTPAAWTSAESDYTYGVAWGDIDGDGDLDLAAANGHEWTGSEYVGGQNRIYLNDGSGLEAPAAWTAADTDRARGLAWGDVDGDGDLDLAIGNNGQNKIYLNRGGGLQTNAAWTSHEADYTYSLAWGDVDGDSDLDLAVGNSGERNRVYLNVGGALSTTAAWSLDDLDTTQSIAWGDVDGDRDLDLAVGNSDNPNKVYLNEGGVLQTPAAWTSAVTNTTNSVAWGDVDGDGDLDLAVGNGGWPTGQPNRLYHNLGSGLETSASWISSDSDATRSVAWGDVDGDGDLDLGVANESASNKVYLNAGGVLQTVAAWTSGDADGTRSIAWGDVDGDGDLDLAVGNWAQPNKVYLNQGGSLLAVAAWTSGDVDNTDSVAWGDVDGDGDLDLVAVNWPEYDEHCSCYVGGHNKVYVNEEGVLQTPAAWVSDDTDDSTSAAWGDVDGDGDLDLAVARKNHATMIYLNGLQQGHLLPNNGPSLQVAVPHTSTADFYAIGAILDTSIIPITYTLFDRESDTVGRIVASYSLDGGGNWHTAVPSQTIVAHLTSSPWPTGTTHTFLWDTFASGVFGRSDNVVVRLAVYPQPAQSTVGGTYTFANSTVGSWQRPYASDTTYPFRVRGTQVRVFSSTLPVAGALVYRLPTGQARGDLMVDNSGNPHRTGAQGYLQGRGELGFGDSLVAVLPIAHTDTYTLYHTSGSPTSDGLDAHIVTAPGVQTLIVSHTNPLVLFDLDVSLEWDARNDEPYLAQLQFDLRRTSEILYDWTDGQVALGNVSIFHDREHWVESDVQIHATNRLRPNAGQGGIVSSIITDPVTTTLTYAPGQVRIGAVWNRYGEPGGGLGEDWPRTLAHELGHYALFLDDNYIGIDDYGQIIPVDGCPGAMSDAYRTDLPYDEFHPDSDWLPACERTLSHQITNRSDWATILTFYPWLSSPSSPFSGPSSLPLNVTTIHQVEPPAPPTTLEDPTFYLSQGGEHIQPGRSARAFLFQDDRLTDLGGPTLDQVLARGARPDVGDRLCVFELAAERLGCETITSGDEQLELVSVPGWLPDLIVSPITSHTIAITLTNVPTGLSLSARLFPVNGSATITTPLIQSTHAYTATFSTAVPALAGYVRAWINEPEPRREIVTDYSLGGSPGTLRANHGGPTRGLKSPAISADGQVILFGEMNLQEGEFFTLQAATLVPSVPPWTTLIGQAYRLTGSQNAPDLSGASISFAFIGDQVPPGEGDWILMYYWDGSSWLELPTQLDTYHNTASAPVQGEGLYALMSSFRLPLHGPGWNLFSYPVQTSRPVSQALLSISGAYTTVYGYEPADTSDPWKVYDVTAPAWVNDLHLLEFANGYWINVSQAITMYLKGDADTYLRTQDTFPMPPATFYGHVLGSSHFSPSQGMTITAFVDGNICGRTTLTDVSGYGLAYTVNVLADGTSAPGCGAPGRQVTFAVGSESMIPTAPWENTRLWDLSLRPRNRIYLPLVTRQHVSAPDLVVRSLLATADAVTVTITNQGYAPTADQFWVDTYIDPAPPPTHVNQTWDHISDQGLVWGITTTLQVGEVLTLTVGGPFFRADLSSVSWPLPPSTPVYAQVDSASAGSDHGAVLENHEIIGAAYNNISQRVTAARTPRRHLALNPICTE